MTRRAITVCLLLAASVPRADAQPAAPEDATQEEARSLFHAGRAAFDVGRYDAALRYFEQSYELSGRPVLLFNLGAAHDRLQHNERALERYRAYLAAMPDAPNRELVERRIAFLTARLVETPTDQSGTSSSSDPSSASNTRDADAPPSSADAPREHTGAGALDDTPAARPRRRAGPWVAGVVAVGAAAAGGVILAIGRADARRVEGAERGTPWADVEAAAGRAPRWSVTGLALLGVGAALGVASLVWGLGSRRDRRAQLSLSPAGVSLRGSF